MKSLFLLVTTTVLFSSCSSFNSSPSSSREIASKGCEDQVRALVKLDITQNREKIKASEVSRDVKAKIREHYNQFNIRGSSLNGYFNLYDGNQVVAKIAHMRGEYHSNSGHYYFTAEGDKLLAANFFDESENIHYICEE